MGLPSFLRSFFLIIVTTVMLALIFKFFLLLSQSTENVYSRHHHQEQPHDHSKTRSGKNFFDSDAHDHTGHGRKDVMEFPGMEEPCSHLPTLGTDQEFRCVPIQRCFKTLLQLPIICGWSGLIPDVCCYVSTSTNDSHPPTLGVTAITLNHSDTGEEKEMKETSGTDLASTSSSTVLFPRRRESAVTTVRTMPGATTSEAGPQTMTSKTSLTKESISSISVPRRAKNGSSRITLTDSGATSVGKKTERPLTAFTLIETFDSNGNISINSSSSSSNKSGRVGTKLSLTSSTESSLASAKKVSEERKGEATPRSPTQNSPQCGLTDGNNVLPFVAAIHEVKGLDQEPIFLCTAVILSHRYISTSESCIKNFTDRVYDLRISTNDHRTHVSQHLVADISIFSPSSADSMNGNRRNSSSTGSNGSSSNDHEQHSNNASSITVGLALLRIAPKIMFSTTVKPVCLPFPDAIPINEEEELLELLFAAHAVDREAESSVTSLVTFFSHQNNDLIFLTDQRLEIPDAVCKQILRTSNIGLGKLLQEGKDEGSLLMCALNSPLFTLNCQHTPGGVVLHKRSQQQPQRWTIRGIEVLQTSCGQFMSPGLYLDFKNPLLLHWIADVIWTK